MNAADIPDIPAAPAAPVTSVLVVDDDRANLDVLTHILKDDYRIQVAKTGAATLQRVREDPPDLILLDILLPDINGFEVLSALQADRATRRIPVICVTGLSDPREEEKAFLLGAVDYIVKPFSGAVVRSRVHTQTQLVGHLRTIEKLSLLDALTDIPNRRAFDARLDEEWRRSNRDKRALSVLVVDVDLFKAYNDTYGHLQGDAALAVVARTMAGSLRRPADFIARMGGEEFGAVLSDTGRDGAYAVAEAIRERIATASIPHGSDGRATSLTASIGIATREPDDPGSQLELLDRADRALYAAKRAGRNRVRS